jgi:HK97 family phage major capsid protein
VSKHRTILPGVRAKLDALGVDTDQLGRVLNDAGAATATATGDDVPITIPDSPAALEEMMHDAGKMKALFKQQDGFRNFVRAYAKAVHDKDQSIAAEVRNQVDTILADWLKEQKDGQGLQPVNLGHNDPNRVARTADARAGLYNARAMGSAIDKEFADSGDYFKAIWHNTQRDATAQARISRVRNAFSSTVPSEGGFLIPENLRSELLRISLETSVVRPRARVIPMETLRVPFPAIDDTSHASSVYGGIVGFWTEEGAALTISQASFGRIVLDAKKLTAYTEVPNELISDSITSFQAFIDQIFPEALGFYEDLAFLRGSGVGEPLGVLNGSGLVGVTRAAGGPAVEFADVVGMYSRMLPSSLGRAVWVAAIDTLPSLLQMTLATGNATIPVVSPPLFLTGQQGIASPPMTMLGRPIVFTEKVPAAGTAGDLSFVDFGFYLVGDRQVMSAMSSPHFKFQNDQTAYRIIERVDGRPWINSAITPFNGGPTLSPFVRLV